jgi:hypothetical protein
VDGHPATRAGPGCPTRPRRRRAQDAVLIHAAFFQRAGSGVSRFSDLEGAPSEKAKIADRPIGRALRDPPECSLRVGRACWLLNAAQAQPQTLLAVTYQTGPEPLLRRFRAHVRRDRGGDHPLSALLVSWRRLIACHRPPWAAGDRWSGVIAPTAGSRIEASHSRAVMASALRDP